jgi:hypothetical protein
MSGRVLHRLKADFPLSTGAVYYDARSEKHQITQQIYNKRRRLSIPETHLVTGSEGGVAIRRQEAFFFS